MARKRVIDPDFWRDPDLGKLEPLARYLFIGCISNADDDGRIQADPAYLRITVFPYDTEITDTDVKRMRDELVEALRSIMLYEVEGKEYLALLKFRQIQKPQYPTTSKLPAPPGTEGGMDDSVVTGSAVASPGEPVSLLPSQVVQTLRQIDKDGYGEEKLTLERVQRVIDAYSDRDHLAEAIALVDWELDGKGRGKPRKDGVAFYRNWLAKASPKRSDAVPARLRVREAV